MLEALIESLSYLVLIFTVVIGFVAGVVFTLHIREWQDENERTNKRMDKGQWR